MRRAAVIALVVLFACMGLSGCGGGGDKEEEGAGTGATAADIDLALQFVDALFEERLEDAKAMAGAEWAQDVSDGVDEFAVIWDKYEFKERELPLSIPFGNINPEGDKRVTFNYKFRAKDSENWKLGYFFVRVISKDLKWQIADLKLERPKK